MDDFDRFWEWANKSRHSRLTIPADLHHAVTSLPREAWHDRNKVNEAVRKFKETAADENPPPAVTLTILIALSWTISSCVPCAANYLTCAT